VGEREIEIRREEASSKYYATRSNNAKLKRITGLPKNNKVNFFFYFNKDSGSGDRDTEREGKRERKRGEYRERES
jgi:hypothetical protein